MPVLSQPLVCPILVGRDAEVSELAALFAFGAQLHRVALLTGEAGIGKSRLARATAEEASAHGWHVFEAHCYEQDRGLAYAAPLNLLRRIATDRQIDAREALRPVAGTIARLLPQLQDLAPAGAPPEPMEPEQETRRLFEAVSAALTQAAQSAPTLLVVEDLHWADQASLDWIAFMAREARTDPLLLLATYRSDEVGAGLGQLLAALDRERLSAEVALAPLTLSQVDSMVRATLRSDAAIRADALQTLHRRAEGIPFLVEELLRSALADTRAGELGAAQLADARIPRGIQEAVTERLSALSSEARELLSVAAIIGDRFDFALLQTVSGQTEDGLLALLRELGGQQLLVEVADDQFRFRHALTRDAVLALLLGVERRAQHARVAAALESLEDSGAYAEDLAYHLFEAAEWERAIAFGRVAGLRALQVHAPHSAIEYLTRAVDAASRAELAVAPDVYLARARAFDAIAAFDDARRDFGSAIDTAEDVGDVATLQDALLGLALLWSSRDYARTREYLDRGVRVARGRGEPIALARALSRLANWYSNTGHYEESRANLDEALVLARDAGDERTIAETVDLLGMTCLLGGRFVEALTFLREAAETFARLGDRRNQSSPLASVSVLAGSYQTAAFEPALTLPEATASVEEALAAAREAGAPIAVAYALWQLGFVLGPRGQYTRACAVTREALQIAEQNDHRQWAVAARCVLGAISIDLLDPSEAIPMLQSAHNEALTLGSAIWTHQSAALLADALLLAGRSGEAAALIGEGVVAITAEPGLAIAPGWYRSVEADVALAAGDPSAALAVLDAHFADSSALRVVHARARALARLGKLDEAQANFEAALAHARRQDNVSYEWRVLADLAQMHLAAGDRVLARETADAALRVIDAIADGLADEPAMRAFRERVALRLPASFRRRSPRVGAGGLSSRELEVARLVARGMSNRAIADQLVLGVRTIETHVANAMARAGQASRSGLATWVVEHGLLADE